jgi:hypothetical protein
VTSANWTTRCCTRWSANSISRKQCWAGAGAPRLGISLRQRQRLGPARTGLLLSLPRGRNLLPGRRRRTPLPDRRAISLGGCAARRGAGPSGWEARGVFGRVRERGRFEIIAIVRYFENNVMDRCLRRGLAALAAAAPPRHTLRRLAGRIMIAGRRAPDTGQTRRRGAYCFAQREPVPVSSDLGGSSGPQEASPSPVYGAALLMRFGVTPHPGFKSRSLRSPDQLVCAVTHTSSRAACTR